MVYHKASPGSSDGKESAQNAPRFHSWVRKIHLLENGMATHSSILFCLFVSFFLFIFLNFILFLNHSSILAWKISWTERSLVGYSPWDCKESDMTE